MLLLARYARSAAIKEMSAYGRFSSAGAQMYSSLGKGAVKEKSNVRSEVTELFLGCEQFNYFP